MTKAGRALSTNPSGYVCCQQLSIQPYGRRTRRPHRLKHMGSLAPGHVTYLVAIYSELDCAKARSFASVTLTETRFAVHVACRIPASHGMHGLSINTGVYNHLLQGRSPIWA